MVELSEGFKVNIINRYELDGVKWLNSIDSIIEKYKEKFKLHNIELAKNLTMNIILFADSEEYGKVVIKIGTPGNTSASEINYMKQCDSKDFVKCYYYNVEEKIMILERVYPGYPLNILKNREERVKIFSNILKNTITELKDKNRYGYKSYEVDLKERIKYVYSDKEKYSNIIYMLDIVNDLYNELKEKKLPQYLLHGDLQHKNILKSNDGWKVIDPHGIIGEKIFEITQFIRAELEYSNSNELDKIVTLISKYLSEDKMLIYKALYISIFSKIVFYIRVKYNTDEISYNIQMCDKIFEYISKENKRY